jgi:hypothetical protein
MIKRMFQSMMDRFIEKLIIGFVAVLVLSLLIIPEIRYFLLLLIVMYLIGHLIYIIYQYFKND